MKALTLILLFIFSLQSFGATTTFEQKTRDVDVCNIEKELKGMDSINISLKEQGSLDQLTLDCKVLQQTTFKKNFIGMKVLDQIGIRELTLEFTENDAHCRRNIRKIGEPLSMNEKLVNALINVGLYMDEVGYYKESCNAGGCQTRYIYKYQPILNICNQD